MNKCYSLFLVVFSFLSGCSDNATLLESPFDSSINGKSVVLNMNHQLILELDLNADAGYKWDCSMTDSSVVRVDSTNYKPKSGNWNQVGGITVETFYFSGIKKGDCKINLYEHRAWESNVAPINTVNFRVVIQ